MESEAGCALYGEIALAKFPARRLLLDNTPARARLFARARAIEQTLSSGFDPGTRSGGRADRTGQGGV